MELKEMIFAVEKQNGMETNRILSFADILTLFDDVADYTNQELAENIMGLINTKGNTESWMTVYLADDSEIRLRYCCGVEDMLGFLNGRCNGTADWRLDEDLCSEEILRALENKKITLSGEKLDEREFQIEIKESLSRIVTVRAETLDEALDEVVEQYANGDIVLDAEDFKGEEIVPYEKDKKR